MKKKSRKFESVELSPFSEFRWNDPYKIIRILPKFLFAAAILEYFSLFFHLAITLWYDMVGNVFIGFLNHKNVGIDTKIMILYELDPELLRDLDFLAAILFLARQKFSSRVPKWHPADFGSG